MGGYQIFISTKSAANAAVRFMPRLIVLRGRTTAKLCGRDASPALFPREQPSCQGFEAGARAKVNLKNDVDAQHLEGKGGYSH
jgi:hypothetical protein